MGTPFNQLPPQLQARIIAAEQKKPLPEGARQAMENAQAGMGDAFKPKFGFVVEPAKKRIRQHQGDGMNKWEREYLAVLRARYPKACIHREVSLPLCNGVRYKLDFLVALFGSSPTALIGAEVKGRSRSTGIVKIKFAAQEYPWIGFMLATKRRKKDGGGWSEEIVRP